MKLKQQAKPAPVRKQSFFKARLPWRIMLSELDPDVDYLTTRFYPTHGGFRAVVITGASLIKAWSKWRKRAARREEDATNGTPLSEIWQTENFCVAVHKRVKDGPVGERPLGFFTQIAILPGRSDLYVEVTYLKESRVRTLPDCIQRIYA